MGRRQTVDDEIVGGWQRGREPVAFVKAAQIPLLEITRATFISPACEQQELVPMDVQVDDFGVKAKSAFHGLIRVKNNIKFVFDIIAERI